MKRFEGKVILWAPKFAAEAHPSSLISLHPSPFTLYPNHPCSKSRLKRRKVFRDFEDVWYKFRVESLFQERDYLMADFVAFYGCIVV